MTPERWQQITEIFHAALAQDAAAREAYLADVCGDDVSLRAEVDTLLTAHAEAGSFGSASTLASPEPARLEPGTMLGPYQIDVLLGAGGMGEVYRARDTRLDRVVAVKVLPDLTRSDPDRRRRFEQEARSVSRLTHPHICMLHDVGEWDGLLYYVMEHLEGETLDQRLARGALPLEHALRYGAEIAGALDHAHRQGVVHRDLKPGNVMLTTKGAMLLDFGLAKRAASMAGAPVAAPRPAQSTAEGMLLGTLQYMAPEQLEGRPVDTRTDIFAFGALLFEMVSGRLAFDADSQASLISAILRDEPPLLTSVQPTAPAALDRVVRMCLEKDPDNRWQSAADLARELVWILKESDTDPASGIWRTRYRTRPITRSIVVVAGSGVFGLVVGAALYRANDARGAASATGDRPRHVQVSVAPAQSLASTDGWDVRLSSGRPSRTALALSPDGRILVFAGTHQGKQQLFSRRLDGDTAAPIAGTDGAEGPFFSPDGRWVGFWAPSGTAWDPISQQGRLRRVSLSGGPVLDILPVGRPAGASWSEGDTIVFGGVDGIYKVRATGGQPERLTQADSGSTAPDHVLPRLLPEGRVLLFTIRGSDAESDLESASVVAQSLDAKTRTVLVESATDGRLVAGRYLVFVRAGRLMAAPFDRERAVLTGPAVGILDDVMQAYHTGNTMIETGAAQFAVADSGDLAYLDGGILRHPETTLTWFDRRGVARVVDTPARTSGNARLSGNLERALTNWDGRMFVHDLTRRQAWRLPFAGRAASPVWTPDDQYVVFRGIIGGRRALYRMPADGSGSAEELLGPLPSVWPACWSPDGEELILVRDDRQTALDVVRFSMRNREIRPILQSAANELAPALSPDGRWLVYVSASGSERPQVYVSPYPSMKYRHQVSTVSGTSPVWTKGGTEILYTSGIGANEDRRVWIMSVRVRPGTQLAVGQPRMLFEKHWSEFGLYIQIPAFSVTPDGQRILGRTGGRLYQPPPSVINLITNWVEEVRAKIEDRRAGKN
jgi:serine/threonine-protein kinase